MKKYILVLIFLFIFSPVVLSDDYLTENSDSINDYIDMAKIYTSSAQYKKALDYIETINQMYPNNPKILYEKAIILKNYNQPILSRNLMIEVVKLAPEYKESYLYKEFFNEEDSVFYNPPSYDSNYFVKKGFEAYNHCEYDKSAEYFEKALSIENTHEITNNLVRAYIKSSNPKRALKHLQRILTEDTENLATYLNLGLYYCDVEPDTKKQIQYLKQAIRLDNNNAEAYYLMGNAYLKNGKYETAVEYYRLALAKDDTMFDAYYALGVTLYNLQDYEQAYHVFEKSLNIELDSVKVYEYLSKTANLLHRLPEAEKYINKAIELNPTADNYLQLVKILYNNTDYKRCAQILKNKIADFNNAEMYNYFGLCNFQTGNYQGAKDNFLKAISIKGKPSYYYNLAVCYNTMNDAQNRDKYLDLAKKAQVNTVEDFLDLAKMYSDIGDKENELATITRAINIYPFERQFYNYKLDLLKYMGKNTEHKEFNLLMQEKFKKEPIYLGNKFQLKPKK